MRIQWLPGRRDLGFGEVYGLIALGIVALSWWWPRTPLDGAWACPLYHHTGVPCPSCGFTRAFVRAAHLDVAGALQVSPLGTLLFLTVAGYVVFAVVRFAFRWGWPVPHLERREGFWVRGAVFATVFANWVYLVIRAQVIGDWG